MEGRRTLAFSGLDQVMPEADRLMTGYRSVGNWTLGQACNHLASTMLCSIEGFPEAAPWLVRKLVGPLVKRQLLSSGTMLAGIKASRRFSPNPGLDDRVEVEALRATIRLFSGQGGPFAPHPFFGTLSPAEWHRFHCIHSAHHLGFVVPEASGVG